MSEPVLLSQDHGRVRVLTLNRPDQLNAMSDPLYDAITKALADAQADTAINAVILTGAGRAFCAGADLGQMANRPVYPKGERHGFQPFIEAVETFSKPLIAAVNGLGVGIGMTVLPYCDRVIMDERARVRTPFVALGVTAEAGSSVLLVSMIGPAAAADVLLTGRWVHAPEALVLGLAHEIAPSGDVVTVALRYAEAFQKAPVTSLVATKSLLMAGRLELGRAARKREDVLFGQLEGGPANKEALAAFREKREPDFSGI
jgi:enoyl-CoA hydratase/carnithine racemase